MAIPMETEVQAVATQALPSAGTHTPGERVTALSMNGHAMIAGSQSLPTTARRRAGHAMPAAPKTPPPPVLTTIPMETEVQAMATQAAPHAETHTLGERVTA